MFLTHSLGAQGTPVEHLTGPLRRVRPTAPLPRLCGARRRRSRCARCFRAGPSVHWHRLGRRRLLCGHGLVDPRRALDVGRAEGAEVEVILVVEAGALEGLPSRRVTAVVVADLELAAAALRAARQEAPHAAVDGALDQLGLGAFEELVLLAKLVLDLVDRHLLEDLGRRRDRVLATARQPRRRQGREVGASRRPRLGARPALGLFCGDLVLGVGREGADVHVLANPLGSADVVAGLAGRLLRLAEEAPPLARAVPDAVCLRDDVLGRVSGGRVGARVAARPVPLAAQSLGRARARGVGGGGRGRLGLAGLCLLADLGGALGRRSSRTLGRRRSLLGACHPSPPHRVVAFAWGCLADLLRGRPFLDGRRRR
mmetsp:Transcript_46403/g.149406  ORF Transcript_46403/g.149406 Transcript_46403/m.149406 type:complete len:371 (-) Transcript_46403:139-1251(-)